MQSEQDPKTEQTATQSEEPKKKLKKHLIGNPWIRRPLKVVGCILIVILLIPILLYIPPVQNFAVKTAAKIVADKTGMKIGIERLRLKFPVDLSINGLSVIEASGDTMVMAKEAIADVKLRPLLSLDVQINRLQLKDVYYRMLSTDSSMLMTLRAGLLDVDSKSSANIKTSNISINEATLKDGHIFIGMDVWKQKPTPNDTTSTPFYITAKKLKLDNVSFTMSMLPTIDTLNFKASDMLVENGVIDLKTNNISIGNVAAENGSALMLAPSAQYVMEHPAPPADTTSVTPPTVVKVGRIALSSFDARYAVKDSPVVRGFDTNDIRFSSINLGVENFYNKAAEISLPITRLSGVEQCGLTITEGSGTFSMDSVGMMLKDFDIRTPYSHLEATVAIPDALMQFMPNALLDVDVSASLGMTDVNNFMPDLKAYTSALPALVPLNAKLKASGELGNADIPQLDLALPGILSLRSSGKVKNVLSFSNIVADLKFDGELRKPDVIKKFVDLGSVNIPTLNITGNATVVRDNYAADFKLTTPHGNLAADGKVGMNSERYEAKVNVNNLNVGAFIGDKTIGPVTASLSAQGAGFNPEKSGAHTDIRLDLSSAVYNGIDLNDITLNATLQDENFILKASSPSPSLSFDIDGSGKISDNFYQADIVADLRNVDLEALGFSEERNWGAAKLHLSGSASPRTWIYDVDLNATAVNWHLPDQNLNIPDGIDLKFVSTANNTKCLIGAKGTSVKFFSSTGLKSLVQGFTEVASVMPKMIEERRLDVELLEKKLPPFSLSADVAGNGIASDYLSPIGMGFKDFNLNLSKDSVINGKAAINTLWTESLRLDTVTMDLKSRGQLLDYIVHLGNRPGTLDEFADVRLSGYLGENRLSAYLVQHNIKKKMGYRLGFTASVADSVLSLRFTPLKATIAYLPWTFNLDNYIDYTFSSKKVNANLEAKSDQSSILLKTEPSGNDYDNLHLNLKNIRVEDFTHMMINPPPVKASINSDINVRYTGRALIGKGNLDINELYYDRKRVGNFNFNLAAGMGNKGKSGGKVGLLIDGKEAAAVQFILAPDSINPGQGMIAERLKLMLTEFPLAIANPFFPPKTMSLSGHLNGDMNLSGSFSDPKLNGSITCDSVGLFMNMLGTTFKFDNDPITVTDNVLDFHEFDIFAVNNNPLTIKGTVDASALTDMKFDLSANASNMQLVGNKSRSAEVSGKMFVNLGATVKGPMSMMNIDANLNVLPTTDVTYNMAMASSDALGSQQSADGVVKFVNFADTTQVAKADSITSVLGMRITAKAVISQGTQVLVNLGNDGKVECNPSGTLNYFQNYVGDMRLNGTLYTGSGYAFYNVMLLGKKNFNFNQNSHITWNGNIMNPLLDITATDNVKSNIQMNGNARLVNFIVTLTVGGNLSAPSILFDLSTDDDMSIANELQSMTADQRQQQAMSLLLTGTYSGPSAKTVNSNLVTSNLYSMLASQLSNLASNVVKGVDINFGVDQYETGTNGNMSTNTSYSYQVSKSLINNRFKIVVGGNYSTDATSDENFQQNLISDIAFEYIIKQSNSMSLNAKLFRHTGFESIIEGEITETGVALSLRRRLANFRNIINFGRGTLKKNNAPVTPLIVQPGDSAENKKPDTTNEQRAMKNEQNGKENDDAK